MSTRKPRTLCFAPPPPPPWTKRVIRCRADATPPSRPRRHGGCDARWLVGWRVMEAVGTRAQPSKTFAHDQCSCSLPCPGEDTALLLAHRTAKRNARELPLLPAPLRRDPRRHGGDTWLGAKAGGGAWGRCALPPTRCTVRERVLEPGVRGPGAQIPTPARRSPPPPAAARSRHGLEGAELVAAMALAPQRLRGLVVRSEGVQRVGPAHVHTTTTLVPHPGDVCTVRPQVGRSPVRAVRAAAQLRRRRRCLARSERVHRVRGRHLRHGDNRVRRHDVGNVPIPKNSPHSHHLQSSI